MLFSEFIKTYRGGALDGVMTAKFQDLVRECENHSRSGSLTLKIDVRPKNAGETEVAAKYAIKKPERDTMTSIMFPSPEGNLYTEDPKQHKFDYVRTIDHSEVQNVKTLNENNEVYHG